MKKTVLSFILAASSAAFVSCGFGTTGLTQDGTTSSSSSSSTLGNILGAVTNGQTISNVLTSIIGADKLTEQQIVGKWNYYQPGVAFTSENLLAKAGGEVAATSVKEKLQSYYKTAGVTSSNTYFQFNSDKSFKASLRGIPVSGTWTYNQSTTQITLQSLLFTINANVKGSTNGLSLLFESKKLLSIFQLLASKSGNQTIGAIGDISKNYDGVRIGFEMSK